jgi:predicted Zn-dependent protease
LTGRVWGLTLVALLALLASIVGAWATAATVFLVTAVIAGTCFAAIQFWLFAASRSNETEAQRQAAETSRLEAL